MADTQRSIAQILALLADNSSGDISPQDLRDAFVTWKMRHGQIYVASGGGAATTVSNTADYFECNASTWTLSSGAADFDESGGNGRLTYTGVADVMLHVACTISFTAASNNQVLHFRLGKSGTTDAASEVQFKIGTGSDVGSTAIHLIVSLSTGQYLSLFVRNETSAANVTVSVANLQAVSMPM